MTQIPKNEDKIAQMKRFFNVENHHLDMVEYDYAWQNVMAAMLEFESMDILRMPHFSDMLLAATNIISDKINSQQFYSDLITSMIYQNLCTNGRAFSNKLTSIKSQFLFLLLEFNAFGTQFYSNPKDRQKKVEIMIDDFITDLQNMKGIVEMKESGHCLPLCSDPNCKYKTNKAVCRLLYEKDSKINMSYKLKQMPADRQDALRKELIASFPHCKVTKDFCLDSEVMVSTADLQNYQQIISKHFNEYLESIGEPNSCRVTLQSEPFYEEQGK